MRTISKSQFTKTFIALLSIPLFFSACQKDKTTASLPSENTDATTKLSTNAIGVTGPKGVCYVEVNNNDIRNVGKYKLSTGQQLFDIAIIFAANINYNTTT